MSLLLRLIARRMGGRILDETPEQVGFELSDGRYTLREFEGRVYLMPHEMRRETRFAPEGTCSMTTAAACEMACTTRRRGVA